MTLSRSVGLKRTGFAKSESKEASAVAKLRRPMKSRGMKGRPPTADEERFMSAIASLGCLACAKDGVENPWISIHHIDGRTKPGAHFLVLGLCAPHHQQDDTDQMGRVSVHGKKKQFEARYGTQYELLAEASELLKVRGLVK
jgi:hypothetical protein